MLVLGRWGAAAVRALALLLPAILALYVLCLVPFEGAMANYFGIGLLRRRCSKFLQIRN